MLDERVGAEGLRRRDRRSARQEQQRIVREAMKNVVPAYDPAACTFERIALSTGILNARCP
jgi:hypothetical protein